MKTLKRTGLGFLLCLFAVTLLLQLYTPKATAAAQTNADAITALGDNQSPVARFVNADYITLTIGNETYNFHDRTSSDSNHEFVVDATQNEDCHGTISFETGIGAAYMPSGIIDAKLDMDFKPVNGRCRNTDPNEITIKVDATNANIWAEYVDENSIRFLSTSSGTYSRAAAPEANPRLWVKNDGSCSHLLVVSENGLSYRLYLMESNKQNGEDGIDSVPPEDREIVRPYFPEQCEVQNTVPFAGSAAGNVFINGSWVPQKQNGVWLAPNYPLGNTLAIGVEGGTPPSISPASGAGSGEDNSCESNGGVLGWIVCPVAAALDEITGFLDTQIEEKLRLGDDYLDTSSEEGSGKPLQAVWAQMRNIAYIILIPIMLVMVIGTALGFEIFSAYTIKKALPRMAIAVIFITLSWYICVFMINFVNVLGAGARGIVVAPFNAVAVSQHEQDPEGHICGVPSTLKGAIHASRATQCGGEGVEAGEAAGATALGIFGVGGLAVAFAAGIMSIGIIGSTIASAALILGLVFLLLIVRQMLILAMILVAPLAILAWIFPGNDKLWKLWWGSFSKLLLIFPLIMLISGVGRVFAYVTGLSRGAAGDLALISVVIIILAYIVPYIFIPFAFKWAGGVFGNLAGMVNDRERGVLDRLKKGRAGMRERHGADAKNFGRFKSNNAVTKRLNNIGGMARNRPTSWMTPSRLRDTRQAAQTVKAAEDLKNDKVFQANQQDDKFLMALGDRDEATKMQREAAARANDMSLSEDKRRAAAAEAAAWQSALGNASLVRSKNQPGTQLAAIAAHAATGYNLKQGQAGYNQLAGSVIKALGIDPSDTSIVQRDGQNNITGINGPQAGNFASAMNQAQYNLKKAGRFDLAGINNGAGYDYWGGVSKANGFEGGTAKAESHIAGAEALGISVDGEGKTPDSTVMAEQLRNSFESGTVSADKIATHHANLLAAQQSPHGKNRKEIDKQLQALDALYAHVNGSGATNEANIELVTQMNRNRSRRPQDVDPAVLASMGGGGAPPPGPEGS